MATKIQIEQTLNPVIPPMCKPNLYQNQQQKLPFFKVVGPTTYKKHRFRALYQQCNNSIKNYFCRWKRS